MKEIRYNDYHFDFGISKSIMVKLSHFGTFIPISKKGKSV